MYKRQRPPRAGDAHPDVAGPVPAVTAGNSSPALESGQQALFDALAQIDGFALAILDELAASPHPGGMSLPRLGKRLGQGASVVLRQLTAMSAASLGGRPGPGWVRIEREEERWIAFLTDAGRARHASWMALVAQAEALEADLASPSS